MPQDRKAAIGNASPVACPDLSVTCKQFLERNIGDVQMLLTKPGCRRASLSY